MLLYKAQMLRLRYLVVLGLLSSCVTIRAPKWTLESTPVHVRIGTHYGLATVGDNPRPLYSVQGKCVGGHREAVDSARVDRFFEAIFRVRRRSLKVSLAPDIAPKIEQQVRDTLGRLNIETQLWLDTSTVSDACTLFAAGPPALGATATASVAKDRPDGLEKTEIGDVVRAALPRFQTCYEAYLLVDRDAAGRAGLSFTIAADGRVLGAELLEDTVGWGTSDCVRKTMMGLQFPKPRGEGIVVVSYPFLFNFVDCVGLSCLGSP